MRSLRAVEGSLSVATSFNAARRFLYKLPRKFAYNLRALDSNRDPSTSCCLSLREDNIPLRMTMLVGGSKELLLQDKH